MFFRISIAVSNDQNIGLTVFCENVEKNNISVPSVSCRPYSYRVYVTERDESATVKHVMGTTKILKRTKRTKRLYFFAFVFESRDYTHTRPQK